MLAAPFAAAAVVLLQDVSTCEVGVPMAAAATAALASTESMVGTLVPPTVGMVY